MAEGSRLARWSGLVRLGIRRVIERARGGESRQTLLSVFGVAVAVALVLLVTSISLGLATTDSVGSDVDYWVVPEGAASSAVTPVQGQRLGAVHRGAERMERIGGVTEATPVLASLMRANRTDGSDTEYVLALGVIQSQEGGGGGVAGLSTAALTPGDPYYAGGGYDGPRTGEAVASMGAVDVLGAGVGDRITFASGAKTANRTFQIVATGEGETASIAQLPVVVVHLSELQTVTGAAATDSADRILVRADARTPAVEAALERVYPRTTVLSPSERLRRQALSAELPLAIATAALLVSLVVGTLFLGTTLGFELAEDGVNRAVMAAVGLSHWSLALLATVQTVTVTLLGALSGLLLWVAGVFVVNALTGALYGSSVARLHPLLAVYGVTVALLIGLLAVPYLLVVERRTTADPDRVSV
jgi:putative ABC transport system permease protein